MNSATKLAVCPFFRTVYVSQEEIFTLVQYPQKTDITLQPIDLHKPDMAEM